METSSRRSKFISSVELDVEKKHVNNILIMLNKQRLLQSRFEPYFYFVLKRAFNSNNVIFSLIVSLQ